MSRIGSALSIYARLPVFAQNAVCTVGGWGRFRARFNPHFHRTLAEWEESIDAPVEELERIQRQRLDRLVRIARDTVPYYRDLPPPSELRDDRLAIEETLSRIPPLEKRHYRDQPQAFISRLQSRYRLLRGKTSGTTGTALPLWYTPETLAEEYATVWRTRRRRAGVGIRDPLISFNGQIIVPIAQTEPPFWRSNHHTGQVLFSIYHMTPRNLETYVEEIHRTRARYVQGYPSSIHLVARAMLEAGNPLPPGQISAVFTSSESLLAFQREAIEQAFGAPVIDRYGVSEFAVSMTECESNRLHVDMEYCIVEVEVREERDDSETGPLLITGIGHDATPLFRYRIGDVGTRSKYPCPCGRAGDNFFEVDGRIEDYVLTPDGRFVGRMDHVFKEQYDVAEAQIIQRDQESIEVLIVPGAGYSHATEEGVIKEIRSRLGQQIEIAIRTVGSIAREPNGKFRAVKSTLGRNAP